MVGKLMLNIANYARNVKHHQCPHGVSAGTDSTSFDVVCRVHMLS
jgi:hypothetical protein